MNEFRLVQMSRRLLYWRWAKKSKTGYLYMMLLLMGNITDACFEEHMIKQGEFVKFLYSFMQQSVLSYQKVRIALSHKKSTKYLTVEVFWKYKVFTVKNNEIFSYTTNKLTIN